MSVRYYTVKARVKLSIVKALENIRKRNGYNTDIKHAHRRRDVANRGADPPEIFLWFGRTGRQGDAMEGTNHIASRAMAMRVWYYTRAVVDLDLEADLLEGDIERALDCFEVYDEFGPGRRQIQTYFQDSRGAYFDGKKAEVLGYLDFEVRYRHRRDNPLIWDDQDEPVPIMLDDPNER